MKKRVLSLFLAITLCLTLTPTGALAEESLPEQTVVATQEAQTGAGENAPPANPAEDTRTEIRCVMKPSLIQRSYDGTTDGSAPPIDLTFTDGKNTFTLTEGTGFTAKKTFDSADVGNNHTVTVEITLTGETAKKYKLKEGEETFTIGGIIDKATPDWTVSLTQTTCAVGETLLPLVTPDGAPEGAVVTYYYTTNTDSIDNSALADLNVEIDENTTIPKAGTYYIFARSTETTNYWAGKSKPVQLTVVETAARVTTADGVNTYYTDTDIHAAFAAAASAAGSTLTLLQDVTLADEDSIYIDLENGHNFTIDWNGHTLTGNYYSNLLTFTGVTSVTLQDSSGTNAGGVCNNGYGAAVCISLTSQEYSVTIEGGTYSPQVQKNNCSGAVTISGGVFKGTRALITTRRGDPDGTLADLLAAGCTFAYDDGNGNTTPFDVYSTYMSDSGKTVYVIPHTAHTFDNGKCTACGYTCPHTEVDSSNCCTSCKLPMAAVVTKDGKSRGYTDFAVALANAPEGSTLKLLAIDGGIAVVTLDKALTFDLNGKQIGELWVNAKATIKDSTGGSGRIQALRISDDINLTLGDLPEEGYAFRDNYDEWVNVTGKRADEVFVRKAPIQGLTIETDKTTYTPDEMITLTATAQMSGNETVTDYQWTYDGIWMEQNPPDSPLQAYQTQLKAKGGTHTVTCTAYCGGYAFTSQPYTITVDPIDLSGATVQVRDLTYNGSQRSPAYYVTVTLNGKTVQDNYYDVVAEKQTNAGSYTLTVTGKGNYTGTIKDVKWNIKPAELTVSAPSEVKKAYDGTTNATVTPTFNGLQGGDKLTAADYSVTAAFEDAKVGYKKIVTGQVTLNQTATAKNYLLNDGNFRTDNGTIAKADAPTVQPVELTIYNGVQKDYFVDLPPLPDLDEGKSYGKVDYSDNHTITLPEGYTAQSAVVADPDNLDTYRLLLHMKQTGSRTGEIGTVTIPVTTSNYQDINLTVKVKAVTQVTVAITPNGGTYGSVTAAAAKLSGVADGETVPVTLTYTGNGYNSTAVPTNAGSYTVTASIADSNYVLTGETTASFVIKPKSIKGAKVVLGKALTANGAEQTQTVEKVLLDGKELPADSYTVAGNTATAPGKYTLTVTAKGNYTGTVEQTYVIIPAKAEDAPGEVKVVVKSEGTVPPTTLLTDKAELLAMLVDSGDITADELAQIADGASVDIALTVKEANVSAEIKTAMAQAAKGCTIGQYLDISLFKYMTVNGKQQDGVALRTTKNALTVSVVVPDALINTNSAVNRTYCIVRNHEGTITVLDAAFDAASKTLTFKTDRFSDYAIAYKDTAVPGSGSNPGSNNSSNGSETKKNEVAAPTPAPASTSKPSTIAAMPQTGDTSNPTLYVVLLVASLLGLAVVFVCKKRNDK